MRREIKGKSLQWKREREAIAKESKKKGEVEGGEKRETGKYM